MRRARSIQATATVLSAITVTGTNLAFGNVTPGVNKTVADHRCRRGPVHGDEGRGHLGRAHLHPAGQPDVGRRTTCPIGTWTGGWNNTANSAVGATGFTPSAAATTIPSGGANLWVWVGATVSPAAAQAAGAYTGNVTMQVAYL